MISNTEQTSGWDSYLQKHTQDLKNFKRSQNCTCGHWPQAVQLQIKLHRSRMSSHYWSSMTSASSWSFKTPKIGRLMLQYFQTCTDQVLLHFWINSWCPLYGDGPHSQLQHRQPFQNQQLHIRSNDLLPPNDWQQCNPRMKLHPEELHPCCLQIPAEGRN